MTAAESTPRKIIHVDMDAFYASVEQRDDPGLRGKPLIVGGKPQGRGVVAAASYEARRYGIRSAMPCAEALRRCPQAVFVPPRMARYREVSRGIHRIFADYTDLIEPLSLDEAYLDVTTPKTDHPYASRIAREIRARIAAELGLTASAGVGPNKFIAKLASDHKKPDGLTVVQPHEVLSFISTLPLRRLWGVGPATAERLLAMGVTTIGEVAALPLVRLESALGAFGRFVHQLAQGQDARPVQSSRVARSRGAETTFGEDISDLEKLRDVLHGLAAEVSRALVRLERPARTITLKVRYASFDTVTRSKTLVTPIWAGDAIEEVAGALLHRTDAGTRPVRLVGVSASNLVESEVSAQLELPLEAEMETFGSSNATFAGIG